MIAEKCPLWLHGKSQSEQLCPVPVPVSRSGQVDPGFYPVPHRKPPTHQVGYGALILRSIPAGNFTGRGRAGQATASASSQPLWNMMRYRIIP